MRAALTPRRRLSGFDAARKISGKPAERLSSALAAGSSGDDSESPDIAATLIKVRVLKRDIHHLGMIHSARDQVVLPLTFFGYLFWEKLVPH